MPPSANPIYEAAQNALQVVADGFSALGIELPTVQIVCPAEGAVDCEMVLVQVPRLFHGFPDNEQTVVKFEIPRVSPMQVQIWRCVPTVDNDLLPPTPANIMASSEEIFRDGWYLTDIVYKAYMDKTLFHQQCCSLAGIGGLTFLNNSGGLGGCQLELQVNVCSMEEFS